MCELDVYFRRSSAKPTKKTPCCARLNLFRRLWHNICNMVICSLELRNPPNKCLCDIILFTKFVLQVIGLFGLPGHPQASPEAIPIPDCVKDDARLSYISVTRFRKPIWPMHMKLNDCIRFKSLVGDLCDPIHALPRSTLPLLYCPTGR